jgi:hypothetical protein
MIEMRKLMKIRTIIDIYTETNISDEDEVNKPEKCDVILFGIWKIRGWE